MLQGTYRAMASLMVVRLSVCRALGFRHPGRQLRRARRIKDGRPYDEQMYLSSVRRRTAVLGAALAAATGCGWEDVAGFKKFC